jgi:hypothetical protein
MDVSSRAFDAMLDVAIKVGVITQADRDEQGEYSNAFIERVKKGMCISVSRRDGQEACQGTREVS